MPGLIVVSGPPGAGKSTVAAALAERFEPSALVAGDDVFATLRRGYVEPWRPEAHAQNTVVLTAAAAASGRLVEGGYTVVYDGVVGPWFLDVFLPATGLPTLDYALLLPGEERCLERVASRTGHEFTDADATRHMYRQFARAPVDPRHVIDSDASADAIAADVADRAAAHRLAVAAGA